MLNEASIMCFLTVAKHLSFSKAAEELFMSRQAVSKTILSLEKRLAVKLFDRTPNVVELTAQGELCLSYFSDMVQSMESFFETLGKPRAPLTRLLIGYELGAVIDTWIVDIIEAFKRKRYNTDIRIACYEHKVIESKLLSGQLDMAFTVVPENSKLYSDCSYIVIDPAEYVLLATKNHPKVSENTTLSDFNGENSIYWNMDNSPDIISRKSFNSAWRDIGITLIPSIQCLFLHSAYAELLLGNAVMPCNAKSEICKFPEVISYSLPLKGSFCCIWNSNASPSITELAEDFRKFINLERSVDGEEAAV